MQQMIRVRRPALLVPVALVLALLASLVVDVASAAPNVLDAAGAAAPARGSFAESFFIARRTNPDGTRSLEVLGSLIIWFLLLLSLASVGLIAQQTLANQRRTILPVGAPAEVAALLQQGKYRAAIDQVARDESFFGRIVHAGLAQANQGHGAILRALEQTAEELVAIRMRRIELLNVLGQVSPMIGLFGTVYGMILAFQAIVVAGGSADPVRLAGGISTALTTTFWGLVVAIPALAAFALLRTRIDELTSEATLRAEAMFNPFRSKPTPPKSADAPRPTTGG